MLITCLFDKVQYSHATSYILLEGRLTCPRERLLCNLLLHPEVYLCASVPLFSVPLRLCVCVSLSLQHNCDSVSLCLRVSVPLRVSTSPRLRVSVFTLCLPVSLSLSVTVSSRALTFERPQTRQPWPVIWYPGIFKHITQSNIFVKGASWQMTGIDYPVCGSMIHVWGRCGASNLGRRARRGRVVFKFAGLATTVRFRFIVETSIHTLSLQALNVEVIIRYIYIYIERERCIHMHICIIYTYICIYMQALNVDIKSAIPLRALALK